MVIHQKVKEILKKHEVTIVKDQPTDDDLNQLMKELTTTVGSVAIQKGGGEHSHIGMIVEEAEYIIFLRNATYFLVPVNPGPHRQSLTIMQQLTSTKLLSTRLALSSMKLTLESRIRCKRWLSRTLTMSG